MTGKSPSFLRLRWLAVRLLSVMWATMGSAAASAERSDFGRSSFVTNSVRAQFKSAEIITREFYSSGGPVEMAAEAIINRGRETGHRYERGASPQGAACREVAGMGFDTLRIAGTRLTGANPGKAVDMTVDLTKKAAGQ